MSDAWAITDAVGCIEDLSPSAARLLNVSRRAAAGRDLTAFVVEIGRRCAGR